MSPSGVTASAPRLNYETFGFIVTLPGRTELRLDTPSSSRAPRIVAVS
jgi:hypothetical protein